MIVWGHRGARGEVAENTLAGFLYARRAGVDHVELDVQLSSDGKVVVIHDERVDRTMDGEGWVGERSADELARLHAKGRCPKVWGTCGVPTLDDVLALRPAFAMVDVELKAYRSMDLDALSHAVLDCVRSHAMANRVLLTSSDPKVLERLRSRAPDLPRGLVVEVPGVDSIAIARDLQCRALCVGRSVAGKDEILRAHRQGLEVHVWTVNDRHEVIKWQKDGADGVFTDFPTRVLRWLKSMYP